MQFVEAASEQSVQSSQRTQLTEQVFKVAFHFFSLGRTKTVLRISHLQGLLEFKMAACWQNDMHYRHILDKPDL